MKNKNNYLENIDSLGKFSCKVFLCLSIGSVVVISLGLLVGCGGGVCKFCFNDFNQVMVELVFIENNLDIFEMQQEWLFYKVLIYFVYIVEGSWKGFVSYDFNVQ